MAFELPITDIVLQFTLVLTAAMIVEVAFERSRVPGLVGLLVLGMLITWLIAGLLLVVVVVAKSGASWLAGYFFGYSRMDRLAMTGLALPQAAATLAVVVTGRQLDLIGSEIVDAIIIVILLTCLLGPLITRYAGSRLKRADAA